MSSDPGHLDRVGTVLWTPSGGLAAQLPVIDDLIARWDLLPEEGDQSGVHFLARGPARLWGGEAAMARRLSDALGAAGAQSIGVAVAPGRLLSWVMARRARRSGQPMSVPDDQAVSVRASLPVGVLSAPGGPAGVDAVLVERLVRLGLRSLGDVAVLPVGDLVGRFGEVGRRVHGWAMGIEPPVVLSVATSVISVDHEFDPPALQVDAVAFAARQLADRLDARLRQRGEIATAVHIAIDTDHGERIERLWSHGEGLRATALVDRVRWQMQTWDAGPVVHMTFTVVQASAEQGRQAGWWGGEAHGDERAARAVARVAGLIGHEHIVRARWRGGRDPVDRYERVAASPTGAISPPSPPAAAAPWPGGLPTPSPARLVRDPVPVEVRNAAGAVVRVSGRADLDTVPDHIVFDGSTVRQIVAWAGPWPLEERWWRPEHRRQARLQVVTADGAAWLVYLEHGQWWLRAIYS